MSSEFISVEEGADVFRDTWVRFFGYTNEVGEAFRHVLTSRVIWSTYGVAGIYVLADAYHKGTRAHAFNQPVFPAVADTLIWQTAASITIPPLIINRVAAFTNHALQRTQVTTGTRKGLVTLVGLAIIPGIVTPVDTAVHFIMDKTTRRLYTHDTIH